jgi:SagB-type dehydrogenase family enzyme
VTRKVWNDLFVTSPDTDSVWELFHENSKLSQYDNFLPNDVIVQRMGQLLEALSFAEYPEIRLPQTLTPLNVSLDKVLTNRVTARSLSPQPLTLETVATLLHYAYGITRDNADTIFPRPFRIVPSGGALYPLEIFFHSTQVEGLSVGLYHYNPVTNCLRHLREADLSPRLAEAMVQRTLPFDASIVFFISAIFERATFKYGPRGYRFVLLEAGHVAQNMSLVASALGLGCMNLGGFFDRQIDEILGFDGLNHSTIYLTAIGGVGEESLSLQDPL